MVNKRRINALIARIEKSNSFDMRELTWGTTGLLHNQANHPCGTAACIAGHLDQMMKDNGEVVAFGSQRGRANYLGIEYANDLHNSLFIPMIDWANYAAKPHEKGHITKEMAIKALERVRDGDELNEYYLWEQ